MDNSTGTYQIWTGPLHFTEINNIEESHYTSNLFELKQNIPNPFKTSTIIGYDLSDRGFVSLKIYDGWGNIVGNLINDFREPGYYEIEFNPAVNSVYHVHRSSVYFCRLTVNGKSKTRRMLLID